MDGTLTVPIQRGTSEVRTTPVLQRRWASHEIRMSSTEASRNRFSTRNRDSRHAATAARREAVRAGSSAVRDSREGVTRSDNEEQQESS